MDFIGNSLDLVRIVFLLGAVLALICKKKFGITPGGIIVPGILACILFSSFTVFLITLATSMLCWAIYQLFMSSFAITSRQMTLMIVSLSVAIGLIEFALQQQLNIFHTETILMSMIVPGLVTLSAKRYGVKRVALSMLSVTAMTAGIGILLARLVPYEYLSQLTVRLGEFPTLAVPNPFVAFPVSIATAVLLSYRFNIRSGGYLIAPFLAAVLMASPLQFGLLIAGVVLSVAAIKLIQHFTLVIGLERFVLSLFCGYFVVSMIDLLAINGLIIGYHSSALILITAVAVLTNDICLQPIKQFLSRGLAPSFLVSFVTRLAA